MIVSDNRNMHLIKQIFRYKICVSLIFYLIICIAFFPTLRYMTGPDGLSYISIAELYANGQFKSAINAYWSPAFSLLLAPLIALGINGILAIKLLNILVGALLLIVLSDLTSALKLRGYTSILLLISAVPFTASSAFLNSTPDLLVVLVLTIYFRSLIRFNALNQIKMGILIGLIGFVGYLAKYYLFPFFCIHFSGAIVLRYLTRSGIGANLTGFAFGMATFILFASFWILAIHLKYGVYTYALTGPTVRAMFSPSRGIYNLNIPLDIPKNRLTDPGVRSVYLPDPSFIGLPGGVLSHLADWSPIGSQKEFEHQIKLIKNGFSYAGYWMVRFSPFLIPVLFLLGVLSMFRLRNEAGFVAGLIAWTSVALLSGYLTLTVEGRFILFLWIIGCSGGVWLLRMSQVSAFRKRVAIAIFLMSFVIMPMRWLFVNMGTDSDRAEISITLIEDFSVKGKIASNGKFAETAMLNQYLGTKYLGILKNITETEALVEMNAHGINYFFVWDGIEKQKDWSIIGSKITNEKILGLSVYRITNCEQPFRCNSKI